MKYANDQLLQGYQYDSDQTMVPQVNKAVNDHHMRRRNAQKAKDFAQNRLKVDYEAKGYKEEGFQERREIMENKLELFNMKLNESISKNIGSFVITSFVSDSYCKREHLENELQKLH